MHGVAGAGHDSGPGVGHVSRHVRHDADVLFVELAGDRSVGIVKSPSRSCSGGWTPAPIPAASWPAPPPGCEAFGPAATPAPARAVPPGWRTAAGAPSAPQTPPAFPFDESASAGRRRCAPGRSAASAIPGDPLSTISALDPLRRCGRQVQRDPAAHASSQVRWHGPHPAPSKIASRSAMQRSMR